MIITNIDSVPGKEVTEVLGIVRGNVVGTKEVGEPILDTIKKALTSTLSWGPKIVTGEDIGLPEEEPEEEKGETSASDQDAELQEYSNLLYQLREKALKNMTANAEGMGADGIINVHFDVSVIMMHVFEVCVYGTAVKLR